MRKTLSIVNLQVADLKVWKDNPKEITPEAFEYLKESVLKNGFEDPFVVDGRDMQTILSGNARYEVAQALNFKEVPCLLVYPKNDTEAIEIALLLNEHFGMYKTRELFKLIKDIEINLVPYNIEVVNSNIGISFNAQEGNSDQRDGIKNDNSQEDNFNIQNKFLDKKDLIFLYEYEIVFRDNEQRKEFGQYTRICRKKFPDVSGIEAFLLFINF